MKTIQWSSIAGMSPKSHYGDEEDERIGLFSEVTIYVYYALCFMLVECSV